MKAKIVETLEDIIKPKSPEEIADLERRGFRQNGGKWKFHIGIGPLLRDFEEYEDAGEFRRGILEILRSKMDDLEILLGEEGEYELSEFQNIIDEFEMLDPDPEPEEVDYPLGLLYDWADENNVWIDQFED